MITTLRMIRISIFLFVLATSGVARADDSENIKRMASQLERMERNLTDLQSYVYKQKQADDGQARYVENNESDTIAARQPVGNVAGLQASMGALKEDMRKLNGNIEEAGFATTNLARRLDKIISDIDFRIQSLEDAIETQNVVMQELKDSIASINKAQTTLEKKNQKVASNASENTNTNAKIRVQAKPEGLKVPPSVAIKSTIEATSLSEPNKDLTNDSANTSIDNSLYDKGLALFNQKQYAQAQNTLLKSLDTEGVDKGRAYYWLAESFYVQGEFETAAVYFMRGYQHAPSGNKAAGNLLKLGMSLSGMDKKEEACTTYAKLLEEFPSADTDILSAVNEQKSSLACAQQS